MKLGYIEIGINNSRFYAHQLAWFFETGEWVDQIDHRNQIRNDNRFLNLRKATGSQNQSNIAFRSDNTSGFKGVTHDKRRGKWTADVRFEGRRYRKAGFPCAASANEWPAVSELKYMAISPQTEERNMAQSIDNTKRAGASVLLAGVGAQP